MNNRFEALNKATSHLPVVPSKPEGKVKDYFAADVFTRERMKEYIASDVLEQLFDDIDNGRTIHRDIANTVAIGMRKWAMDHGATHYTHWFQPLTGGTAEKHDAFFTLNKDGLLMEEFFFSLATRSVSQLYLWHTQAKRWTTKRHLFARRLHYVKLHAKFVSSSINKSATYTLTLVGNRNISLWTKHYMMHDPT